MKLKLDRKYKKSDYTIGKLYVNGEYFCDTLEDTDRGLSDDMTEDEISAAKVKGSTAIPTGTYDVTLDVMSPKYKSRGTQYSTIDYKLPRLLNVKCFDGILIHCLTSDTEILTDLGWKNYKQFISEKPSNCFSYNTEKKCIELTSINNFVEQHYNGNIYKNEGRRINYAVTHKHKMYVGTLNHKGEYIWSFRDAEDVPKESKYITAALKEDSSNEITDDMFNLYKLIMAVQADGYIVNWSNKSSQVRFHFKKERKIKRAINLIENLNGKYRLFVDKENKTHIQIDSKLSEIITEILNPCRYVTNYKELPNDLLSLPSSILKELVMEYLFWDGKYENYLRNNKNMIINSSNEHTIDILQAMCTLSGMRSYKKHIEPREERGEKQSNQYELVLYENQDFVIPTPETYKIETYNGIVWCVSNKNHTIITRLNGRTVVLGNCGNTNADTDGCILVGENNAVGKVLNSTVTFYKLYNKLLEDKDNIKITIY